MLSKRKLIANTVRFLLLLSRSIPAFIGFLTMAFSSYLNHLTAVVIALSMASFFGVTHFVHYWYRESKELRYQKKLLSLFFFIMTDAPIRLFLFSSVVLSLDFLGLWSTYGWGAMINKSVPIVNFAPEVFIWPLATIISFLLCLSLLIHIYRRRIPSEMNEVIDINLTMGVGHKK